MKTLSSLVAGAGLCCLALSAQAQAIVNGDFESGLAGWAVLGDASVQPRDPAGQQLWLTTASIAFEDDSPLPAGALNRSGTAAAATAEPGGVEDFAGLAFGALDPDAANGLNAFEGSAARQVFSGSEGELLSFRWNFGTSDAFADFAFVTIDGQLTRLAGSADATLPGAFGNLFQTGEATYSVSLASTGVHTLVFGVVDVGDYSVTSTLAISGIQVAAVPEVNSLLLMLSGLAAFGAVRHRRRSTSR